MNETQKKLEICSSCQHRQFSLKTGVTCGLTKAKPDFEGECSNYEAKTKAAGNPKEAPAPSVPKVVANKGKKENKAEQLKAEPVIPVRAEEKPKATRKRNTKAAEVEAETKPAAKKTATKPAPEPKAEPAPKAEPKVTPKVEPKAEPKAEPKTEPAPKAEPKPIEKLEPKPQPKPQPRPKKPSEPSVISSAIVHTLVSLAKLIFVTPYKVWKHSAERLATQKKEGTLDLNNVDGVCGYISFIKRIVVDFVFDALVLCSFLIGIILSIAGFIEGDAWYGIYGLLATYFLLPGYFAALRGLLILLLIPIEKLISICATPKPEKKESEPKE